MADRHKTDPKAVRMPDGLLAWYEQHAKATGVSVNKAIVIALEDYAARRMRDSGIPGRERDPYADRRPRPARPTQGPIAEGLNES